MPAKNDVCRQEASDAKIEARRSRNTKIKTSACRMDDAMFKGELIAVVWLVEHHGD